MGQLRDKDDPTLTELMVAVEQVTLVTARLSVVWIAPVGPVGPVTVEAVPVGPVYDTPEGPV